MSAAETHHFFTCTTCGRKAYAYPDGHGFHSSDQAPAPVGTIRHDPTEPIPEATDAELDAKMLRELRENIEWRFPSGISITGEEGALILRIVDERDALKRELCEEREGSGRRPFLDECRHEAWESTNGGPRRCLECKILLDYSSSSLNVNTHVITRCAHCPHAPHGAGFLCHSDNRCGCRGGIS